MTRLKEQVASKPSQPRDLVKRTFEFAVAVRQFVNQLPKTTANFEDVRQLVRSSGSVAANYLEAQEAISRKNFFFRIKICRKESRETHLWLRLVETNSNKNLEVERAKLIAETDELTRIFSSIAKKGDSEEAV